jgi:hypothetical protein
MPLKLNVGLSRKIGEANYGSRGASIHIEMEADSTLVSDPGKFHERIRQLFGLVRTALAEELNGTGATTNGYRDTDSPGKDSTPSKPHRPATQSQIKALHAITKARQLNLSAMLGDRYQLRHPEDLSIKQASDLIDALKAVNGQEGRRG